MSIAITDDHRSLADTASALLAKHGSKAAARALLEVPEETLPALWGAIREVGWLGLHIPEEHGGSGYGLSELVVVVEALGSAIAPGPIVPTLVASAVIMTAAPDDLAAAVLPGLADGSTVGAFSVDGTVEIRDGLAHGTTGPVISGALADLVLVAVGPDVAMVDLRSGGATVEVPTNLDPTRPATRITFDGAPAQLLPGAHQVLVDLARLILAAEAIGIAREVTHLASEYAKVREQFGRPIATFQAVKHHCANMLVSTELATAAVWDAARAAASGGDQLSLTAAMAAALAVPAAYQNSQLNIQVHGGIGYTWEHDAHLYLRRAAVLKAVVGGASAANDVTALMRGGTRRIRSVDLPPEAESIRSEVQHFVEQIKDLDEDAQREQLLESGYLMPHWPAPWGRDAGAVEQLVIEQEFTTAGIDRPNYGITGWVILTLIQHADENQIARWVRPALNRDVIWCQLFSEPDAGSDAAGIKTRGTRVDGGWLVSGQKVWTSGAHISRYGLATVRTNPDAPKHAGITTMVVDLESEGVEVRPLKMPTGGSEFNEVFLNDVFVPDDDVVGPVDGGWTVARATLGNESVSIGGGGGGATLPGETFIDLYDHHPERLIGGAGRIGTYIANQQAMAVLNLRTAHRAVAGGGPGPEGNVAKLVTTENGHEAAAMLGELTGSDGAFLEGAGATSGMLTLLNRALSIAGGTSEIKRNQIGERILGLPRDPLIN